MDDKEPQKHPRIDPSTISRTVVFFLTLVNGVLAFLGKDKLPFAEDEVYQWVTIITTVASSIWAWWQNNPYTLNARKAEEYRKELKQESKQTDDTEKEGSNDRSRDC